MIFSLETALKYFIFTVHVYESVCSASCGNGTNITKTRFCQCSNSEPKCIDGLVILEENLCIGKANFKFKTLSVDGNNLKVY